MHVYTHERIHAWMCTRKHVREGVYFTLVGIEPMLCDSEAPLFRLHLELRQVAAV